MKSDKIYILHIVDSIDQIFEYTEGLTIEKFENNRMIQDAVIRNFEIIGEASKNISSETKNRFNQIPWKNMAGMRDKLIHNYMGVDLGAVWNTIEDILNPLKTELTDLIEHLDKNS